MQTKFYVNTTIWNEVNKVTYLEAWDRVPQSKNRDRVPQLWHPMLNKRLSKKIQAAQNKCIRFYLKLKNTAHIGVAEFKAINWLSTKNRMDQCVCANVMKFFNGIAPAYSAEIFHPANLGRITRRSKFKLEI